GSPPQGSCPHARRDPPQAASTTRTPCATTSGPTPSPAITATRCVLKARTLPGSSAAVAALELLAGAAGARIVASRLPAAQHAPEVGHACGRRLDLTQVAGGAHRLQLAHVVVVERQDELDRLRAAGAEQAEVVQHPPGGVLVEAVLVGQVDPRGAHEREALPPLAILRRRSPLEAAPECPPLGRAAGPRAQG